MSPLRPVLALALLVAACGTGSPTTAPTGATTLAPSTAPTDAATDAPSDAPTDAPSATAGGSLDPSQSDAGIVGQFTITNDTRGGRDGTHTIVAVAADGSSCSANFDGETYTAVAWYDDAPDGMIHQMAVRVGVDDIPEEDGESTTDITDGRVYADFISEGSFGGTAYGGDVADDPRTSVTIDVTRVGDGLVFDFDGSTWDAVGFSGQLVCAEG